MPSGGTDTQSQAQQFLNSAMQPLVDRPALVLSFPEHYRRSDTLGAKPREVRAFLCGQLAAERTQELHDRLLAAGVPL